MDNMNNMNNMNNTDNKSFKKGLLITVIIATILVLVVIISIAFNSTKQNNLSNPSEEEIIEPEDNNEENTTEEITSEEDTKDDANIDETAEDPTKEEPTKEESSEYETVLRLADGIRLYMGIGTNAFDNNAHYTSLKEVPNEAVALFIQANTKVEDRDYGYSFNQNEVITYCMPPECPENAIITEDANYASAQGLNRAYLFDKVKQYAKTSFNRNISISDIKGVYLTAYKYEGKDYVIDSNPGFTGPISINKVEQLINNNGIYEATISLNDAEKKFNSIIFKFKLLNNTTIENLNLNNLEIIDFEIK